MDYSLDEWDFAVSFTLMTIAGIAKLANVPYATAWRVINNRPVGSSAAIEAVQTAMQRVHYAPRKSRQGRPHKSAEGIRTHNVALLHLREGTPVSSEVLASVQRRLLERNLNLIFAQVDRPDDLPQAVETGNVDGILGYGAFPQSAVTPALCRIPAVWLMSRSDEAPDPWGDRVRPDHVAIGRLASRYLLDRGHQRFAYLNPGPGITVYDERGEQFAKGFRDRPGALQAFCAASHAAGPPEAEWMEAAAASLVSQWLASPERPTGVFCPGDRVTARVHAGLVRAGIKPGRDLEIVSCDNQSELLSLLEPRPASIDLNRTTIARLAVDRLLWRMRHGMASPAVVITVAPTLETGGGAFKASENAI